MRFPRSSGILLHPTSLPSSHGCGDLGPEAYRFADWLAGAGQRLWQVLPLGPTGYGDSPYQSFSAFAGNPLLISLELVVERGYLDRRDLADAPLFPTDFVDYEAAYGYKLPLLRKASARFRDRAGSTDREVFEAFCKQHAWWQDDYALFMALKEAHGMVAWPRWDRALRERDPGTLEAARRRFATTIQEHQLQQFAFFEQWAALRRYCQKLEIRLMGDAPIYVAHDSADVWANPQYFHLREDGNPALVAGVPPDYFSATGQLWGNPIYRWDRLAADEYRWWIERLRAAFALVDILRVDHFRGFEAYWEVPAGEETAVNGRWVKGPGGAMFERAQKALGLLPIVAENLGVITPEVEAIRHKFGFPGMAILQFAFGNDPQGPDFRPHNYPRERVAYTGTHDNDTTLGWWTSSAESDSTRSAADIEKERAFTKAYLHIGGDQIQWAFIRALMASVADTVIFPMQDVIGLGTEARMNLPGRPAGNWRWRMRDDMLSPQAQRRLKELAVLYER
ncbi:MAG TPA: 4-alpha-glucanotransferase [Solibacterales bacterium]|nr:4-alpha-glucanotransferase [Bryobacterales bacterium]